MRKPHAQLYDYISGNLPPQERDAFERHLASCPRCREAVARERKLSDSLKAWKLPDLEPRAWSDWKLRQPERRQEPVQPWFWQRRWLYLPAACAAMLVAGYLFWAGSNPGRTMARSGAEYDMLDKYELIQWLDVLENWDALQHLPPQAGETI
jgi:anti-sigma factor RsiW